MSEGLRMATQSVIFLAVLAILGLMMSVADLQGPAGRVLSLIFAAWVAAPYVLLFHTALRPGADRLHAVILMAATVALAAFVLAIYYDAMFVHLDPRSGIVFFVVPVWQMAAAIAITWALTRRLRRMARRP